MIKVKVIDTFCEIRKGTSKAGKAFSFNVQKNVFVELNGEVRRLPFDLEEGKQPYPPGNYTIDPISLLTVGRFGLELIPFARPILLPDSEQIAVKPALFGKTA
ncbi:MAG: single-stranded DNA-binding protein [Paludibacter sp.]|nr:single-stranded DNA-binding protein [Paludibacter sp.]